jgi:O-methyltransferase domain/Dimerisation domain
MSSTPSLSPAVQTQSPQEAAQQLFQIASGYMPAAALYVATSLNIADHLAHGPKSVKEIASLTGSNEQALYRILRALASVGIFSEVGLHYFANTPMSEPLRSDSGNRDLVHWLVDDFHFKVWGDMLHSAKTGQPAVEHVYGKPCFDCIPEHPDIAERFNAAMTSFSAYIVPAVLDVYDFSGINTLVDVAGGRGFVLTSILKKYPEMRGILFEMPYLLESAKQLICDAGCEQRCDLISGDFFQAICEGGDAYYMQHIIHDWDDDKALTILKNTRKALADKPHGRVIIVDAVVQPGNGPDFAKFLDLEMLVLPGGKERTEEEFRNLLSAAGFQLNRVIPTASGKCVIEGICA